MQGFTIASLVYGIFLIASGSYRYYMAGSKNALGFGLVMGVLALVAALLSIKNKSNLPYYVQIVVVIFVGGFFTKKIGGDLEGDSFLRVLSLILFSLVMAMITTISLRRNFRSGGKLNI